MITYRSGFTGDENDCSQEKNCNSFENVCHENATCLSHGVCQCKKGFMGNGISCNPSKTFLHKNSNVLYILAFSF